MRSNEVNNIHLILNAELDQIIVYSTSQHSSTGGQIKVSRLEM